MQNIWKHALHQIKINLIKKKKKCDVNMRAQALVLQINCCDTHIVMGWGNIRQKRSSEWFRQLNCWHGRIHSTEEGEEGWSELDIRHEAHLNLPRFHEFIISFFLPFLFYKLAKYNCATNPFQPANRPVLHARRDLFQALPLMSAAG